MEIPTLSEEEKQKLFMEMWLGAMTGPMEFIMRKLGPEALDELNEEAAKHCAADLKGRGVDDALKFAMNYGVVNKNIFGGDVEVTGNPEKAVLQYKEMQKPGSGIAIRRKRHANNKGTALFRLH